MSDDGKEKNELQSVTEEEEGEDSSQVGSEAEIDKKKKKPLKSALKSKPKSKTNKKDKVKVAKETLPEKPKGLNKVSSAQTISSVVADLDNLSKEISQKFYKIQTHSNNNTYSSYQTPEFYHDSHTQTQTQMMNNPNRYHRAQVREDQYRNNYRDYNIDVQYDHRRNDYEHSNKFFSQSVQPQHFDNFGRNHMQMQREYQDYLPPISQRIPNSYHYPVEQPNWNHDPYRSQSTQNFYAPRDPEYQNNHHHHYMDNGFGRTQDSWINVPQKLDIRSLYKNKPRHLLMEQDSELRNGYTANSLIRPPQTAQNFRTKSMIPSASAIHIHRGI